MALDALFKEISQSFAVTIWLRSNDREPLFGILAAQKSGGWR
jgi:hypothetical protein